MRTRVVRKEGIPFYALKQRQSLPLEAKLVMSQRRIREWYEFWHGQVYVAFSGGKDSTVLLHIVRAMYPKVSAVFCNTGLEFPEIVEFVKKTKNVIVARPKMSFKAVLEKYGYPVISKENAGYIREIRSAKARGSKGWVNQRMYGKRRDGGKTSFCLPKKWHFMVDAPFKISERCCDVMKKNLMRGYVKASGNQPFVGVMAQDSSLRRRQYLRYGCNTFLTKNPKSAPLGFWRDEDVWEYIRTRKVPYSRIYNMGYQRTGCVFCMFGVHLEKEPNRFQLLKRTHPKLWKYCMEKLELRKILKFMGIPSGSPPSRGRKAKS